jgi:hypothetical protein
MEKEEIITVHRKNRNKRFLIAFFSVISIILSLVFFTMSSFVENITLLPYRTIIIFGVVLFTTGLALVLSVYLNMRPTYYRDNNPYENEDLNGVLNYHLKKNFIDKYGSPRDFYREKDESKEELFSNELSDFKNYFIKQSQHDLEFAHLFEDLYKLDDKFKKQIERLISNSNLNLIIGITTTALAIIILGFSIFQDNKFESTVDLLAFFTPRISTVIFVEIFSFFFLKLYKNNLNEIKYFQNEITNLNFKISSLKTAIKTEDKVALTKIITTFSETERNFILKKDETTEKLESLKTENNQSSSFTKSIKELVEAIKK